MSQYTLDEATLAGISQELPEVNQTQRTLLSLSPDFISVKFPPESTIPISTICLRDAGHTLVEARYALHEALAHLIWFRERREPPSEIAAVFYCRFYADDTALRLYSAGEHLAKAIVFMLEINDQQLEGYRKRRSSQQSIVGHFLVQERPNHPITQAALELHESSAWQDTMKYRNNWVHKQPPTVKGLGTVYRRRSRWHTSETGGTYVTLGGGDRPEYSVDDLLSFIRPALFHFADAWRAIVQFHIELLESWGIVIPPTPETISVL